MTPGASRRLRRAAALAFASAAAAGAAIIALADRGDRPSEVSPATAATTSARLSSEEQATLLYMREEEKLARDAYLALATTAGDRRFVNIARSEQQHMDAVGALLTRYGIDDPTAGRDQGEFADPALQRAHDELLARGSTSPAAALAVGRDIERMDLTDIADRRATVAHDDIAWTLDRLADGSRRHLTAFSR